jgi:hypothetical protein
MSAILAEAIFFICQALVSVGVIEGRLLTSLRVGIQTESRRSRSSKAHRTGTNLDSHPGDEAPLVEPAVER